MLYKHCQTYFNVNFVLKLSKKNETMVHHQKKLLDLVHDQIQLRHLGHRTAELYFYYRKFQTWNIAGLFICDLLRIKIVPWSVKKPTYLRTMTFVVLFVGEERV